MFSTARRSTRSSWYEGNCRSMLYCIITMPEWYKIHICIWIPAPSNIWIAREQNWWSGVWTNDGKSKTIFCTPKFGYMYPVSNQIIIYFFQTHSDIPLPFVLFFLMHSNVINIASSICKLFPCHFGSGFPYDFSISCIVFTNNRYEIIWLPNVMIKGFKC